MATNIQLLLPYCRPLWRWIFGMAMVWQWTIEYSNPQQKTAVVSVTAGWCLQLGKSVNGLSCSGPYTVHYKDQHHQIPPGWHFPPLPHWPCCISLCTPFHNVSASSLSSSTLQPSLIGGMHLGCNEPVSTSASMNLWCVSEQANTLSEFCHTCNGNSWHASSNQSNTVLTSYHHVQFACHTTYTQPCTLR